MIGMRQFAVTDGGPQLIQQVLRQADIDTGDEHVGAQTFQLLDASAELFLVLSVRHKIAGRPDAGSRPVRVRQKSHSHTILPLHFAHTRIYGDLPEATPPSCSRRTSLCHIDGHGRPNLSFNACKK